MWAFFMYYIWVIIVSCISTIVLAITCASLYKAHPKLLYSMFSSTGMYVVCSICSWIPRMLAFVGAIKEENTYLSLYFFGSVYFFIFNHRRRALTEFERTASGLDSECDTFFSWDVGLSNSLVSVDRSTNSSMVGLSVAVGVSWNLSETGGSKSSSYRGSGSNRGSNLTGTGSHGTAGALPRLSEASETETTTTAPSIEPVDVRLASKNHDNVRPSMLHHLLQAVRMSRVDRPSFAPQTMSSNGPSQELHNIARDTRTDEGDVVHSPMTAHENNHVPTAGPASPPSAHALEFAQNRESKV
eukprot:gene33627-40677_t